MEAVHLEGSRERNLPNDNPTFIISKNIFISFVLKALLMKIILCILLFSLVEASVFSQQWSTERMMDFKRLTASVIAPDGNLIAYEVSSPLMKGEKSEYLTQIWIASTDGNKNYQFTSSEKSCTSEQFSPDSKFLAYKYDQDGKSVLVIKSIADGQNLEMINLGGILGKLSWAPNGSSIAFTMTDPLTEQEEKDKKEKRDMIVVGKYKNAHLYILSFEAGWKDFSIRRLTRGDFHVTDLTWSPDSKTIAFTHQKSPDSEAWFNTDLSSIPADSGKIRVLADKKGQDFQPVYSPDGKWIAFASDGGKATWTDCSDVYIMPTEGGAAKKLAVTFNRQPHLIKWSADGQSIWMDENFKTSRAVYRLPVNGKNPEMITAPDGLYTSPSFNKSEENVAFIFQNNQTPPDVEVLKMKDRQKQKLSSVNHDFESMNCTKTEVISWKSKDGKFLIEGLLTYPKDYQPGRKYPLIVNIHGGPASLFNQSYTGAASVYPLQVFAERGYAVLRPNPRGSGGYGEELRNANHADWGYGDYEDIMAGVDHLVRIKIADPKKLFVCGTVMVGI